MNIQKHLRLAIKVFFVFGLLYFLAKKGFISLEATQRAILQWRYSLPGAAGLVLASFVGVIRWNWLLRAHDIKLPLSRIFQLTFVGYFFNTALPGAVSGDFVKAYYVGKETQALKSKAFGSILFDRVAGLSALVVVSAIAFTVEMASMEDSLFLRGTRIFVIVAASTVVLFYGYLFLVRENSDPLLRLLKKAEIRFPKLGLFKRVYEGLRHYHSHRVTVLKVLVMSVLIHLMIGWCLLQFTHALGDSQVSLLPVYVVFPIGILVTSIPVLPAGLGTGHAAFLYLFGLLGSQRGADVFSIYALSQMFIGTIGGCIYLRFRSTEPAPAITTA